ncbi:hypothetical protein Tco_0117544 [Tanacetum coccineum]
MSVDDLFQLVLQLMTRIESLETDLKQTKQTMGNAIVKLVKKVKKMEKMWIFLSKLILAFSCKLRASPRVPSNLDNWDTGLPQLFEFAIHDFNRLFNKMELVIHMETFQRND